MLTGFEIIRPRYEKSQAEAVSWLAQAHAAAEAKLSGRSAIDASDVRRMADRIRRFGSKNGEIASRGTEMPDVLATDFTKPGIFGVLAEGASPFGAEMESRSAFFLDATTRIFELFYEKEETPPQHLIHVTCTGYVSPSAAQKLVARRGWSGKTEVTHAYHMGCYASVPALRLGKALIADGLERVDIVHTELCTLHFNPADHSPDQLVVQNLFADGHVRYTLRANTLRPSFEMLKFHEWIVPDSADCMTWIPSQWGMKMTVSRDLPEKIASNIKPMIENLVEGTRGSLIYAIHPGGPRIIDSLARLLELNEDQVRQSREVLRHHGNMSSATLPFIWKRILDDPNVPSGQEVVSLAFGPGLSIFGTLMRKR